LFFNLGIKNKTVKELRKNQGLTARELAERLKLSTAAILRIDDLKLKEVPEPMNSKITPILRGDDVDKIPWL
jgi:transcriptional regulator with XRE-family HTH domain